MFKKVFLVFLFFFIFLKEAKATNFLDSKNWLIENFQSTLTIEKNTVVSVEEKIIVNFFVPRHGIFRIIPVVYSSRGRNLKTNLTIIGVTDESGYSYEYKKLKFGQGVKLIIGNPNTTFTGLKTFIIRYKVYGVVQRYKDFDELYWNVTGHEWDTKILNSSTKVISSFAKFERINCFAGFFKSLQKFCQAENLVNGADFSTTKILNPGEDFTIIIGISKDNELIFPGKVETFLKILVDNWYYFFSLLPLIIICIFWYIRGRDVRYKTDNVYYKPDIVDVQTVALFSRKNIPFVYYPLDGLTPSEVGTILDEKVDTHDIIAEIVELARLGFIRIEQLKTGEPLNKNYEYAFIALDKLKNKREIAKLKEYQRNILDELFRKTIVLKSMSKVQDLFKENIIKLEEIEKRILSKKFVVLSALKDHFYEGLTLIKENIYKRMESEGYFFGDPEKIRLLFVIKYFYINILVFVLLFFLSSYSGNFGPLILQMILIPIGTFLTLRMPRRTPKGFSLYRQIEGLKYYLTKGEWRYEQMERNLFFEEILPLAIALKVVNKISKDMKGINVSPPSYISGFNVLSFTTDFGRFYSLASANLVAHSPEIKWHGFSSWSGGSGSSGGFSGGGFGGGGGGSW